MAALARATTEDGPGPLEGLHPNALLGGVRAALQAGLADDLDWLAPEAAGAALYELASALPIGSEQREIGRRVLARLVAANAGTSSWQIASAGWPSERLEACRAPACAPASRSSPSCR